MRPRFAVPVFACALLVLLSYCHYERPAAVSEPEGYWAQVDTVSYVGIQVCASCHPDQYASYQHTGMGRSFGPATRERSDADFSGHPRIYDRASDLWYHPFWRNDTLRLLEYRVEGPDTVHQLEASIHYIIGSGQHTNSHLMLREGYLYQAPVTFYTQEGRWDLAPGFEDGHNSRFSRLIETECLTCHNGLPDHRQGSLNAYNTIPHGIDCERCHGPGGEHVRRMLAGRTVDTARQIDYSIVHPGKLALEAQLDLCQRCHLQGITVLNDGADWFDFRPGDRISEHWNIFLPNFAGGNGSFLMASQAERLRKSACFIASDALSCVSCHNPHVSVRQTPREVFNQACQGCHQGQDDCSAPISARSASGDHCFGCHMPRTGSVDIPHVTITDHKVRIPGREDPQDARFQGLECLTEELPSALTMARAYLRFYEAFSNDRRMLDSAVHYLNLAGNQDPDLLLRTRLHAHYLAGSWSQATALLSGVQPGQWSDAWACYRAGESWLSQGNSLQALPWLERAANLLPEHPDFQLKLANACAGAGQPERARSAYREVIRRDPLQVSAWSNLAFLDLQQGDLKAAEQSLLEACRIDPDYLQARLHLVQLYQVQGRYREAGHLLERTLRRHPSDPSLLALQARQP
jgi:Flp pilus assembly protein TadD